MRSEKEGEWNNALNVNSSLRTHEGVLPNRFMISIGGFGGHGHEVRLMNEQLLYRSDRNPRPVKIRPTAEQWLQFWAMADTCGLWNWARRYDDPAVLDGTQWEVDVQIGTRTITSFGSNSYPDGHGVDYSEPFRLFLRAVRELIGGRRFG